jgi:hypothetical protein
MLRKQWLLYICMHKAGKNQYKLLQLYRKFALTRIPFHLDKLDDLCASYRRVVEVDLLPHRDRGLVVTESSCRSVTAAVIVLAAGATAARAAATGEQANQSCPARARWV